MKNKKGFTLIELLAVIVILAIIMIIAIPKIMNVIENSRKQGFKESAQMLVKAAQLNQAIEKVDGTGVDREYTFSGGVQTSAVPLNFKGDVPDNGIIKVKNGKVAMALISKDKRYCVTKSYTGDVQVKKANTACSIEIEGTTLSANVPEENLATWTVTFDSQGGSIVSSKQIKDGRVVGTLSTPTLDGNTFDGWYTSASGGEKITENTIIHSDVTYYAKWKAHQIPLVNKYKLNESGEGYTYQSSNTSVATIDSNGIVSRVADGEVDIIVKLNGSIVKTYNFKAQQNFLTIIDGFISSNECSEDQVLINTSISSIENSNLVRYKLTNGVYSVPTYSCYGSVLIGSAHYVIFTLEDDADITFTSGYYSDSGGSVVPGRYAIFSKLNTSNNTYEEYYRLDMDNSGSPYGKHHFEKGTYKITTSFNYSQFNEFIFE